MYKLVLLRHGESQWNLDNRFTGWTDVDLTKKGETEAYKAGRLIKDNNIFLIQFIHLCLNEQIEQWKYVSMLWALKMQK